MSDKLELLENYQHLPLKERYDDRYKIYVFQVWYENGRMSFNRLLLLLQANEMGNKPTVSTLNTWRRENEWDKKADLLDKELYEELERSTLLKRIQNAQKQADLGRTLQEIGLEYLQKQELNGTEAIRAIVEGAKLLDKSLGTPEILKKINDLSDDSLMDKAMKLLGKMPIEKKDGNI